MNGTDAPTTEPAKRVGVTPSRAAEILECCDETVRRLARAGLLRYWYGEGIGEKKRPMLVDAEDVEKRRAERYTRK